MRGKITTKGFEAYLEKIAAAGKNVDQAAAGAVKAGGDVALAGMQRRVPKDTRNLEQHLVVDGPQQDGNFVFVEVGLSKTADADTTRYGNAQEFGTSTMAAQPYVRPTLAEDAGQIKTAMRKSLEESEIL